MKLDSFFNRFFREYPPAFFELIGEDQQKAAHYQFKSVEVKELAFRFDGIFLPATKKDELYFFRSAVSEENQVLPGVFC